MFESILSTTSTVTTTGLSISSAIICMIASLVLGIAIAMVHTIGNRYSKKFIITISLLPLLVQVVIMMVNGNLGTSVAILGAFSLIRFRSMPGDSRELISVFFAMAVGLAIGMGHIWFAVAFTIFASAAIIALTKTKFGDKSKNNKTLKITIPENLDYAEIFDDIFAKYTKSTSLERVKTTNLGSMFELTYNVIMLNEKLEKDFIDEIRCRNGNLTVSLGREQILVTNEL